MLHGPKREFPSHILTKQTSKTIEVGVAINRKARKHIQQKSTTTMTKSHRFIAQEIAHRYLSTLDVCSSHTENVRLFLWEPVTALTAAVQCADVQKDKENQDIPLPGSDWQDYVKSADHGVESLAARTKARMDAFLLGITLALPTEESSTSPSISPSTKNKKTLKKQSSNEGRLTEEALKDFGPSMERTSSRSSLLLRSLSVSSGFSSASSKRRAQISESDLVLRLELYLRAIIRAKSMNQECTVSFEPARVVKARAQTLVASFVESVSTIDKQGAVLARLLATMTLEVLSVAVLSENLIKLIRRMVSDYEHKTSFSSLAFLSSPEHAAEKTLTPMVVAYLCHLRCNWKAFEADCELELLLQLSLDASMRHTFKTVEFRSMDHLLDVCRHFRDEMQHIEVPAETTIPMAKMTGDDDNSVADLHREIISVNGRILPILKSHDELTSMLHKTLKSRRIARNSKKKTSSRRYHQYDEENQATSTEELGN